ncbi:hypothetical protein AB4Z52_21945 [Rhizobium sp. 2YAF20]
MAAQRAQWKGFLKVAEVSFGVALRTAASTTERIAFNTINKATGNRVNRVFVDSETDDLRSAGQGLRNRERSVRHDRSR